MHAMALDVNSTVWTFISWGRPFQLISPSLDCSSPETTPIQMECDKTFSAILTRSGDVYVLWPFGDTFEDQYQETMAKLDKDESMKAIVPDGGRIIPCHTWEMKMDPVRLPTLPDLPDLPMTGLPEEECRKETKLIKIATLEQCFIGLTNKGYVLKINGLQRKESIRTWFYVSGIVQIISYLFLICDKLPNHSEIENVKKHSAFHPTTSDDGQERPPQVELSSDTMLITHVSYITFISSEFCLRFPNI